MSDDLPSLSDLLATPRGFTAPGEDPTRPTRSIEMAGDSLTVEAKAPVGQVDDSAVQQIIRDAGLDPEEFEVVAFRRSDWTMGNGEPGESTRYSFRRRPHSLVPDREVIEAAKDQRPHEPIGTQLDGSGFIVAIGDLQVGKIDGDGVEGTVARAIDYLDRAVEELEWYRAAGVTINHVHVAWLGDHIEGFESQGGKNSWRTPLGLTDQLRIVRRVMMLAVQRFAPLADVVTMAAVPGNHGRVTANGGMTRYSDNFDTDCLVAVADACSLNPDAFGHVRFVVPELDELTCIVDVAGTHVAHAHGHQWRPGKHMAWWQGQHFGGRLTGCDLLLAGHLHHWQLDSWGQRTFIQVPALEAESTWYRHATGVPGSPGIVVALTKDGLTTPVHLIR